MGLLRSEAMKYGMLVLPQNEGLARKYLDKLGQETRLQFEDMNSHSIKPRPYRRHVQRLDEMERILRFLFEELGRVNMTTVTNYVDEFLQADAERPYDLSQVEAELKKRYVSFTELTKNDEKIRLARNQVAEEKAVLKVAVTKITRSREVEGDDSLRTPLNKRMVKTVAGVINQDQQARFAVAINRATRGNSFADYTLFDEKVVDPRTGQAVSKSVFVVYFQGDPDSPTSATQDKILKLCTTFSVNNYRWPDTIDDAYERLKNVTKQLDDQNELIGAQEDQMRREFKELVDAPAPGRNSLIEEWRLFCIKEKSLYHVLNMFEGEQLNVRANCWYAASEEDQILDLIKSMKKEGPEVQAAHLTAIAEEDWKTPPTYIRTNELTDAWQTVINTYGIPSYQECNPALFTVVTFPFIFGMMYGDVGHGTCLMLAGAALIWKGESIKNIQAFQFKGDLYWVRYLVFQLGFFATFAGFLYNDMFSVSLPLFSSRYEVDADGTYVPNFDYKNEGNGLGGPYPFGVDWAWAGASNQLLFLNSLKMKMSVLFGVLQMMLGLVLRFMNAAFFKSKIDFVCECIPMLIFMVCFFGWMDFMILYKWVTPDFPNGPPGIINSLICMAMGPMGIGQTDTQPLWEGENGGMSSTAISSIGMNLAMLAIPWLLIFKPLCLGLASKKAPEAPKVSPGDNVEEGEQLMASHEHDEHEEGMDEIIIHQVIETIEYVLGTISHTASYLRIWALSLAHQQLSEVFFEKTISMGLNAPYPMNGIMIYIMFIAWFGITCAVLLGMDVLECFLHTLRLHWIEFDSKFFKAKGYEFLPYSIKSCITEE